MNIKFLIALILAWIIHEITHLTTAKILGIPARLTHEKFKFFYIELPLNLKPNHEFLIAMSAPIMNLILMIATSTSHFANFHNANMILALGNLIPILPLDAGRAICIILSKFLSYETATKILTTLGKSLAIAFAMAIFHYQLKSQLYLGTIWLYYLSQSEEKNTTQKQTYIKIKTNIEKIM